MLSERINSVGKIEEF